jgi:hypothetical protein
VSIAWGVSRPNEVRVRILHGGIAWDFGWRSEPTELGDAVEFSERRTSLLFLLPFRSNPQFVWGLRRLLAERNRGYPFSHLSDEKVLDEIAWLLATRQLWLKRTYRKADVVNPADEASGGPLPPLPPPPQASGPSEPPPDEPVFMPNIDAAAIAAAQREAAQSGVPFCEE